MASAPVSVLLPDQCSNYYELLGLPPFAGDVVAIEAKFKSLMRDARKYQVGPYSAQAARHLELLSHASACLLDPEQKRKYDEELRREFGLPPVTVASTYAGAATDARLVEPAPPGGGRRPFAVQRLAAVAVILVGLVGGLLAWSNFGVNDARFPNRPAHGNTTVAAESVPRGGRPENQTRQINRDSPRNAPLVSQRDSRPASQPKFAADQRPVEPAPPAVSADVAAAGEPDDKTTDNEVDADGSEGTRSPSPAKEEKRSPADVAGRSPRPGGVNAPIAPVAAGDEAEDDEHAVPQLNLSSPAVLRELRELRQRRTAGAPSKGKGEVRDVGWRRALVLVRYGQAAFAEDRAFQRRLAQEIVALKKVFPPLRDALSNAPE